MKKPGIIFLALISALSIKAQNLSETYLIGNNAYQLGKYETAISLYERVIYFDSLNRYTSDIYEKLADAFLQEEELSSSAYYYDLAFNINQNNDVSTDKILVKKAICSIKMEDYFSALTSAFYIKDTNDVKLRKQKELIMAISYFQTANLEASKANFLKLSSDDSFHEEVEGYFLEAEKLAKKTPKRARTLGMIFPGLGYYYLGEWKKGINSTVLVGGLAVLLVAGSYKTGFVNSFFNIMPWYQRYFIGGYTNAEILAKQKLADQQSLLLKKLLDATDIYLSIKL